MKYQVIYKQPKKKGFITHKATFYKIEDAIMNKQNKTNVKILPLIIKENSLAKSLKKLLIMLTHMFYLE